MKRLVTLVAAAAAVLAIGIVPAGAVTNGELDGNRHPYVGLVTFYDSTGVYLWRCSGTSLSSTVLLTAGHCTEPPAASAQVWFDSGPIPAGDYPLSPIESRPPCTGYTGWPCTGGAVRGTPHPHPDYNPDAFIVRDAGVVVFDDPVVMQQYGTLPGLNSLDQLKTRRGKQDQTFTAVGYGLQRINPVFVEAERVRMLARPHLIQINAPGFTGDFSLFLSNNASTGGTCLGDSGGPNFLGDSNVVAGVTSFGLNGNCAGTGGVFRMDRSWSLDFVNSFLS